VLDGHQGPLWDIDLMVREPLNYLRVECEGSLKMKKKIKETNI
jgi:hypothetical protein